MPTDLEKRLARKAELTPNQGFNVVAIDDFGVDEPGDELYLVVHLPDRAAAERAAEAHREETNERTFVYGGD